MKLKSLAALMMAGVMALGLCACTNSGTPDESSTPDTSEVANAEPVSITTTDSWDLSTGIYPALPSGSSNVTLGFTDYARHFYDTLVFCVGSEFKCGRAETVEL